MLCGAVAFDLITFGWQKIYHLQFIVPLGMLDLPFTEIDDVSLMWAFLDIHIPSPLRLVFSKCWARFYYFFQNQTSRCFYAVTHSCDYFKY
jgi:hypothetical protein